MPVVLTEGIEFLSVELSTVKVTLAFPPDLDIPFVETHSSAGKESARRAGDPSSIHELGRSLGGGHGNPLQCSSLENPWGHRRLAGYSPWDHKE